MTGLFTANAPRLRLVLSIALALLVVVCAAVTVFGISYLRSYSEEVSSVVMMADSSTERINQIETQIAEYDKISDAVDLAEQVVAKRESYQYQNNAYSDLLKIADRAGVNIEQYSFESELGNASNNSPAAASGSSPEGGESQAPAGDTIANPSSTLKPIGITISLTNPVNYKRFLNFLYYIEQNLTKMQIKSITLSSTQSETGTNSVNTGPITVEVYTK